MFFKRPAGILLYGSGAAIQRNVGGWKGSTVGW